MFWKKYQKNKTKPTLQHSFHRGYWTKYKIRLMTKVSFLLVDYQKTGTLQLSPQMKIEIVFTSYAHTKKLTVTCFSVPLILRHLMKGWSSKQMIQMFSFCSLTTEAKVSCPRWCDQRTNRERFIPVHFICDQLVKSVSQSLLTAHALTCYDTTSSPHKNGKNTASLFTMQKIFLPPVPLICASSCHWHYRVLADTLWRSIETKNNQTVIYVVQH